MVYANNINLLGEEINIKKKEESLMGATEEAGTKQEQRKSVHVSVQTERQNRTIRIVNKLFQKVDKQKHLRITVENQNLTSQADYIIGMLATMKMKVHIKLQISLGLSY
jgi:capsular polysaccharide biosynthesis protein